MVLFTISGWGVGGGGSGGAMVLGKLPVPGRPTYLDYSRARAYCACRGCGLFGHFFSHHFSFLSPCLWETARYRLKYCLKGPLSPKTTNQPPYRMFDYPIRPQRTYSCPSFNHFDHTGCLIYRIFRAKARTFKESKNMSWKQYVSKLNS